MQSDAFTTLQTMIQNNHAEVRDRLTAVEAQVKLTNGRVRQLEKDKAGQEAVEAYILKQKANRQTRFGNRIAWATLVVGALGALWWVTVIHVHHP